MFFVYRFFVIYTFLFSFYCRCRVRSLQSALTTNPTVLRVIANSETVSTTINTTTKTTVNIDQSILNTLNLLASKGLISNVNQNNSLNPLAKYSMLTNNPISALGTISSSNLIPVITKISTVNSTTIKSSKNASENVIGIYNLQNTPTESTRSAQSQPISLQNLNLSSLTDSKLKSIPQQLPISNDLTSQTSNLSNSSLGIQIIPVAILSTTRTTSTTLNPSSSQQNNSSIIINNNNKQIKKTDSISGTATIANIQSRIPEKGFQILDRSPNSLSNQQSSFSSIFNPFETLIKTQSPGNKATTPQQIDETLTSSVLTNLISTLIPDLSQYSKQTKQLTGTLSGSNRTQSRNFSVNLKNSEQSLNTDSSNLSLKSKVEKPDFSLKLEEDIKTNISSLNTGQKQSTFTNIEKIVSSQTLLTVYSDSNIFSNSIKGNNTKEKERIPPQIKQEPGVVPEAQENNESFKEISFFQQFKPDPNINSVIKAPEAPQLPLPQNQQQQIRYLEYVQKFKPFTEAISSEIIAYKSSVFISNLKLIEKHNANKSKTYEMGLNKFTDISEDEFLFNNAKIKIPEAIKKLILTEQMLLLQGQNGTLIYSTPEQVTINHKCFASDVIDQGKCGPSWIISALEAIQITSRMYGVNIKLLSIQQIISCGTNNRTLNGCENGYFSGAYDYTRNFGVGQNQIDYYYDQRTKRDQEIGLCNISLVKSNNYYKNKQFIESSKRILYGNCKSLVNQLKIRALSVTIEVKNFQFYTFGIFEVEEAASPSLHGVTLVGYDPKNKYLIKNSWGRDWGQNGYAYVSQSTGICNHAIYPILGIQNEQSRLKCGQK